MLESLLFLFNLLEHLQPNAKDIIRAADEKMRGETSHAIISIKIVRPQWTRELTAETWTKGKDKALIRIITPAKERGITYLKRKKEVWMWMPALEKMIKLPPSMMSQSWMGSDYTNDDLVKESSVVEDYKHTIIGDTIIENKSCFIIQMIPKEESSIVWGKVIVSIDKKDLNELNARFFNDENKLINTMNTYDIKEMDTRIIPTRFEMIPYGKTNQRTILTYISLEYNKNIEDIFFTPENIKTLIK